MKRYCVLLSFLLAMSPVYAQDLATIGGTVTDPSGAAIPGVTVTVANPEKGFTRELVSNPAGEYTAALVPIGNYTITAEAKGFRRLTRSGISLTVGQTLRVDLELEVGLVTQEVKVTGNLARVETETAAISDVVTGSQIRDLQLNGRNFVALALLVPGAAPFGAWDSSAIGIFGWLGISFNGGRYPYNNWEIDGGPNTDGGSATTFNTYPSLDTIAEFRISTSNYGADMGKHSGATIEVTTKSGTRDFHGTFFEYLRNDKLDANDWFVNRQIDPPGGRAPKRPLKWNDFGYNLGGPFVIPRHYNQNRDKTFFFWSQNWRTYREGTVVSAVVPSQRMRRGDFSECDPASPNFNPAISGCNLPIDPATGEYFPGHVIRIDPNGQALLDALLPLPNNGVIGYLAAPTVPQDWRQEQFRVDHNLMEGTRLFVRYTQDAWDKVLIPAWGYNNYDSVAQHVDGPGKSAVLNLAFSLRPNLMNEFVMGFTMDEIAFIPEAGPGSPAGSLLKPPIWSANNLFAANRNDPLLPGIFVCGGVPFCVASDPWTSWFNSNPILTWKDNLAWSVGKHTLKLGFFLEKYRKNEQVSLPQANAQGFMQFFPWSAVSSGNALADLYLGRITQYTEGTQTVEGRPVGGYAKGHWRMTVFEPYFQDGWKVTPKLTLNLGARYYLFTRIHDVSHPTVDAAFMPDLYDPSQEALLDAFGNLVQDPASGHIYDYTTYGNGLVECGTGGILAGCTAPYYWTLAPRFGFAYDLTGAGKTVLRGGYGIYYEMGNGNESNTEGIQGNPPVALAPNGFDITGYQKIAPGALGPVSVATLLRRQKWGSVQQFSMGVQHEFPGNNVLSVGYVGNLGRHLSRIRELSQVPIGVGTMQAPQLAGLVEGCDLAGNCDVQDVLINGRAPNVHFLPYRGYSGVGMRENTAVSDYDSLQVNFRHVFGQGLAFQTAYTWSHGIDDASSTWSQSYVDDSNLSRWRASSEMNRTHMLVLNYVYELPFFRHSTNALARGLLGGWKVSGITSFLSGSPIDFGCGILGLRSGIGGEVKCNSLGTVEIKKGAVNDPEFGPTPTWFDPNVIGQVTLDQLRADGQPGMFGNMGRNALTGPGRNNWDMALLKEFDLPWFGPERSRLQFRWETFNTFNHAQWQGVNAGCSDLTPPGEPCGGNEFNRTNGQVKSAWPARVMQFGLKLCF